MEAVPTSPSSAVTLNQLQAVACGLMGFFLCWMLIRLILRRSIWFGALDAQRQFHQSHQTPIPRVGGLAIACAFAGVALLAMVVFLPDTYQDHELIAIVLCALAMFGLGFVDDIRPLPAKLKLAAQVAIAAAVVWQGVEIEGIKNPFTGRIHDFGVLSAPITVFWIVAITNLINLIDGIDGLAGGIGFMVMCLLAYVGVQMEVSFTVLIAVGMTGALLGFLYYNFPPARIYMGDGGAYLVGFLIGTLAVESSHKGTVAVALLAPMFALALPIVDVALAIMRRGVRGLPIFRPDRKHIHHRLSQLGLTPLQVVLILYALSLLFLGMGFAIFWTRGRLLPVLVAFGALVVIIGIRSMGWIHDWLTVRHLVGNAGQTRRDVRYALALCHWFDLSAERTRSPEELWNDFTFCIRKLGFSRVSVRAPGAERVWERDALATAPGELTDRQELSVDAASFVIEFHGSRAEHLPKTFFLLTELTTEAWMRAVRRWQRTHETPFRLSGELSPGTSRPS